MKKLLFILSLLIIANLSFAQVKVGSNGNIIATGHYPVANGSDIKGTLHFFQTIVQRNALPANFRDTGMLAYVGDSAQFYYLNNSISNSAWTLWQGGGSGCAWTLSASADSLYEYVIDCHGDTLYVIDWYGDGGGGSGSYHLPYLGDSTKYLGGDTVYHALPKPTLQNVFDNDSTANPQINAHGGNIVIDSANSFIINGSSFAGHVHSAGIYNSAYPYPFNVPALFLGMDSYKGSFNTFLTADRSWSMPDTSGTAVFSVNGYSQQPLAGNLMVPLNSLIKMGHYPNGVYIGVPNVSDTSSTNQIFYTTMPDSGRIESRLPPHKIIQDTNSVSVNFPVYTFVSIPNPANDTFYNQIILNAGDNINGVVDTVINYRGNESYSFISVGSGYRILNHSFNNATGSINRLQVYTVSTLPALPTQGDEAAVTDATTPTYLGALTGGGSTYTPVSFNGTIWVSH